MVVLTFQKGGTSIMVYPSLDRIPHVGQMYEAENNFHQPLDTLVRIVRGRRPDIERGICRHPDGTAKRIIPDVEAKKVFSRMRDGNNDSMTPEESPLVKFFVDFDGELFEPTIEGTEPGQEGIWRPCTDEYARTVYQAYLSASPHYKSFRGYHKAPTTLAPRTALMAENISEETQVWDRIGS
jgi:hypothetical protein